MMSKVPCDKPDNPVPIEERNQNEGGCTVVKSDEVERGPISKMVRMGIDSAVVNTMLACPDQHSAHILDYCNIRFLGELSLSSALAWLRSHVPGLGALTQTIHTRLLMTEPYRISGELLCRKTVRACAMSFSSVPPDFLQLYVQGIDCRNRSSSIVDICRRTGNYQPQFHSWPA
ncbi:hypothetical protein JB92DRAFT_3016593 [Gautieria morchelliformis]|nr:hypothetical protein JB92DRAFT_3016593 [Gautieria morchelliformis]